MSHSSAKVIKRQDLGKTQGSIPTTAGLQSELLNNCAKEASIYIVLAAITIANICFLAI